MEFLFITVGSFFGAVIAYLFFKNKNNAVADTSLLDNKIIELEKEKLVLSTNLNNTEKEVSRLSSELKSAKEQFYQELYYRI